MMHARLRRVYSKDAIHAPRIAQRVMSVSRESSGADAVRLGDEKKAHGQEICLLASFEYALSICDVS